MECFKRAISKLNITDKLTTAISEFCLTKESKENTWFGTVCKVCPAIKKFF